MKQWLRALEVLAWFAFFAVAALVLALRYWILPDIERYRPDIVAAISEAVGLPVKVGGIDAGWSGLRPHIRLTDVRIHDAQGREALVLPSVENVLAWRSLLHADLVLHSLVIEGPRLAVRRDPAGALYVAGIRLAQGRGDGRLTDWVLAQEDIVVRKAEIEWRDEKRGAPPLALGALELHLRNDGDEHAFGLVARTPTELGSKLEVRASAFGRSITEPAAWNGRLYAEIGYTDLGAWRPWIDYALDLREGQGALRAWVTLANGALAQITADVEATGVVAQLADAPAPLELASLRGRLQARTKGNGYEVSGRALAVVPARGQPIPPADFQVTWMPGGGSLAAKRLDLGAAAQLYAAFPMPEALRERLGETMPRGLVEEASVSWHGALPAPERFAATARFAALALQPAQGLPGFEGLSGTVEATESRGRLLLDARNAQLELPQVFPQPRFFLESLKARADWERHGSALAVRLASAAFSGPDFAGTAQGSFSRAGENTGRIDLAASLSRADGSQVSKYLPFVLGERTREWLTDGIVAGRASDVRVRLQGNLRDFPFRDPSSGEFRVTARVTDGVLDYARGWPRIEGIDADLLFERDRMEITGRSGLVLGAKLSDVRVRIPTIARDAAHVAVSGRAEGATSAFLEFVAQSPVRRRTGALTETLRATGTGTLRLELDLPLYDLDRATVAGEYSFSGNGVRLHPEAPPLERASGKLVFTESGFTLRETRARALRGPVALSGGTRPDKSVEVVARGRTTIPAVRGFFDHPVLEHLSGASAYVVTFGAREGASHVRIESPLRGVTIALPPPFEKSAPEPLPLRVEFSPSGGGARERVSLALGRIAAAQVEARRASVWLSPGAGPIRLPEAPGTLVYGSLERLDGDAWLAFIKERREKREKEGAGGEDDPLRIELAIDRLDLYGKQVRGVSLRAATAAADGWVATVKAKEIAGELAYSDADGGKLTARLEHFTLPEDAPGARTASTQEPYDTPAIDVVAERFRFRGKDVGRVEITAQKSGQDWRIRRLAASSPEAKLEATGTWHAGSPSRTALKFQIEAEDAGGFLARVGHPQLVKGARTTFSGELSWQGTPLALHYPSLTGELELHAQDGQFLEIDPGMGKLVSLMSLQALPRRVVLDFRDVFSKGFQFDRLTAGAKLKSGVMELREFQMTGSAAEVQMSGEADLARETQDLKVRVVPGLGNSASTAVAIGVNPVAGVAAALAQHVLKNPLGRMFAYDYAITGSWSDPKVAKLNVPVELPTP